MLNKEAVLFWNEVENVLYEENGDQFVVVFDLFNNHKYFYCRKGNYEIDLIESLREDIYDAIDKFNKIVAEGVLL
jgi:hypothetical protein